MAEPGALLARRAGAPALRVLGHCALDPAGAEVTPPVAGEPGEAQLREQVERAWAEVSGFVDRIIGSGRMLDRDTLLDLARFLESAMPAVGAYERLVARALEDAIAEAGVSGPQFGTGER